jgi:hypothetical protein
MSEIHDGSSATAHSIILIRKMFAACEDFWGAWF